MNIMRAITCAVFGAIVVCLLSAWQPSRSAEATPIAAPDYSLHRVTDKIACNQPASGNPGALT